MKRVLALSAAATMVFAACGSSDSADDVVDDVTDAVDEAATTDATEEEAPTTDAMEEEAPATDATEEAPEEEAMEEGSDLETLRVAYFQEWPTPNLIGFDDGSFGDAVGVDIEWVPFGGGGEMSEAMEAGDIDISYSQGLTPFANTVNNGADLKVVGIAVAYAEADNCVAQGELGVTKENAAEVLDGATVMTPSGNVTNFKMLSMMDFLGVDIDSLNIVPTDGGATTLAAFESGEIDVGCSFGGSLVGMQDAGGSLIMTGAEQVELIGINTYDIISIPASFGEEHGDVVTSFLKANQEFNEAWAADPEGTNGIIASAAGMEDVGNFLAGPTWFSFPTIEEQLGDGWFGDGTVASNMTEQIQTFVDLGQIPSSIGDFSGTVDTSYLEAAQG